MPCLARRRPRLSAKQRKAAIVQAAIKLFGEKGFRGATTRELAAAVGVTEPVLYEHFATKSDLYRAMLESICDGEQFSPDPQLAAARAAGDDHAYFSRLAGLMLDWYEKEPPVIRLLLFSALEGHDLAERFYERRVVYFYRMLTDYIAERIREKIFRPMDPHWAARVFTGMVAHQGLDTSVFGREEVKRRRKQLVATIVDIFLKGMQSPRSIA